MSSTTSILKNIHVSKHPCLKAKLSQLRSKSRTPREIKTLVHEIALIIGCEALAMGLEVTTSGTVSNLIVIIFLIFGDLGVNRLADADCFGRMNRRWAYHTTSKLSSPPISLWFLSCDLDWA